MWISVNIMCLSVEHSRKTKENLKGILSKDLPYLRLTNSKLTNKLI